MQVVNRNGYLTLEGAVQVGPTPNKSGKIKSVEYIVNHYTAGGYPKDSSVQSMLDPNAKRAAHLFVDYDGTVYQLASLDDKVWHAGESSWNGRAYLNGYSIGIEFANPGVLSLKNGLYITYYGKEIPRELVHEGPVPNSSAMGFWCEYTKEQIEAGKQVHTALLDYFTSIIGVVGHSDIAPGRKQDPGPLFPISEYQCLLNERKTIATAPILRDADDLNNEVIETKLKVTVNLNLRKDPSSGSELLTTIPSGSVITGRLVDDGWYAVTFVLKTGTAYHGYVSAKYTSKI